MWKILIDGLSTSGPIPPANPPENTYVVIIIDPEDGYISTTAVEKARLMDEERLTTFFPEVFGEFRAAQSREFLRQRGIDV